MATWIYSSSIRGSARNELFRNDGDGVFTPVTNAATTIAARHTDASWIDHDGDGLVGFVRHNPVAGPKPIYSNDFFFHNLGDGQFQAWTSSEVGQAVSDKSAQLQPGLVRCRRRRRSGPLCLLWLGPTTNNFLYRNDGGRLVKVTAAACPARQPRGGGLGRLQQRRPVRSLHGR